MSNFDAFASTALTDAERVDVRRYCGYPLYGPGAGSFEGYRYFQAYGALEFRLTNMTSTELQALRFYVSEIQALETALPAASAGLNVASAAVFTRNPRELQERKALLDYHRGELCNFLGVPQGPGLRKSGSNIVI